MIALDNVTLRRDGRALVDQVSLACAPGSVTALIGPNGAGKSTLLALMAGDMPADAGTVSLAGRPIDSYRVAELAALRAVLPQDSVLRFGYRVDEVVRMGRTLRDLSPAEDDAAIARVLEEIEITELAARDATTLSGGEQARTTFARVRAQATPVLLLDEPTAALDLRYQERLLIVARRLAAEGQTVVVVLHDLNLAAAHADTLALLDGGRLIDHGPPWQVLDAAHIGRVYRQPVSVLPHPERGCPIVVTAPGPTPDLAERISP